jgi:hypothetical protein
MTKPRPVVAVVDDDPRLDWMFPQPLDAQVLPAAIGDLLSKSNKQIEKRR